MLDLSTRETLIASLPHGGVCAEIGVDYGHFSERILALNEPYLLCLIDCWENQNTEVYGNDPANNTTEFKNGQYSEVVKKFRGDDRVLIRKGYSTEAAVFFPDGTFDWVFIDANHLKVTEDIIAWLPKVKKGGYVLGHDYTMVGDYITVKKDVDDFVKEHGLELFVTTGANGDIYEKNYPSWGFIKP